MTYEIGGPIDKAQERRIRENFARQGLMAHLGAAISEIRNGFVAIRMAYRPQLTQQHSYFHAGGLSAIADSAGGYAGFTMFPDDSTVLTVEFKVNLLSPAQGEAVEAIGRVVKSGRTLTVCQLEVFAENAGKRSLVAIGQQTLICLGGRQDVPRTA